jgi:molybdopterin converting factor small subunit
MKISLRLGEPFWRTVGQREIEVAVPDGATVADALAALAQIHPALASDLSNGEAQPTLFVGDEVASPDSPLANGAKVYLVWPVSGG